MMQFIHAHEVMKLMIESGRTYTRDTLKAEMADKFGPEAQFNTCSMDNMSPDALIDFLDGRGKLSGDTDGEFKMDPLNMCSH